MATSLCERCGRCDQKSLTGLLSHLPCYMVWSDSILVCWKSVEGSWDIGGRTATRSADIEYRHRVLC